MFINELKLEAVICIISVIYATPNELLLVSFHLQQ